ncbi:MAG TPA: DUF1905 domain-containing protein [Gemmatimonadales bacterium]|nr:DUF1905 domain-containing protein [Gemmatimonadales bacterium]
MARSRTASPAVARFVARIDRVSLIRYVDVPGDAVRFAGPWLPVQASCNGAKVRGSLASRGGGAYRLALNATVHKAGGEWTRETKW